jgi:methyl-accepting chemotaxis protein
MLAELSIRAKITVVVSFLQLAMTGIGLVAVFKMQTINADAVEIQANWMPSVRALGELRAGILAYRSAIRAHLLAQSAEGKAAVEKRIDAIVQGNDKIRQDYEKLISSAEQRGLYRDWAEQWLVYAAGAQDVMALSRNSAGRFPDQAIELNETKMLQIGQKADELLKKDIALNNNGADAAGSAATTAYNSAFWLLAALIGLVGVIGAGISIYLVRDVSRGIDSIVTPMQALGRGELTAVVPHQGEHTEIGTMADALQVFKDALIAKRTADQAAMLEAEAKIAHGQRVDSITRDFETMIGEIVDTVSSASTELEASANTLTATADRAQELTSMVAAASEEASSNVQSVATATEQMTSSVGEISRQVQESATVARHRSTRLGRPTIGSANWRKRQRGSATWSS